MKSPTPPPAPATLADLGPVPPRYEQWRQQLASIPWMCHGTVVCRPLRRQRRGRTVAHGPYYLWTCKEKGRTVCVAVSPAQAQLLRQAIANQRRGQKILHRLQALTLKTILRKVPGVKKRK